MNERRKGSRPYKSGKALAKSLIEMVNLMYQNHTAESFLTALYDEISKEMKRRKITKKEVE